MVKSIPCRKVYKFRMDPTELEALELERTASVVRFVYNWGAQQGSRNCAKARRRVAKIHERTANLRQEFLHQLSHLIVITWSVICFEDLSLKALARNKHAKSWLDAAFGELLRQVEYKALWNRKHFVLVDRFFPSTKLCSECGHENDNLSLSDREWTCPGFGTHHLKDRNAARNVRAEG